MASILFVSIQITVHYALDLYLPVCVCVFVRNNYFHHDWRAKQKQKKKKNIFSLFNLFWHFQQLMKAGKRFYWFWIIGRKKHFKSTEMNQINSIEFVNSRWNQSDCACNANLIILRNLIHAKCLGSEKKVKAWNESKVKMIPVLIRKGSDYLFA